MIGGPIVTFILGMFSGKLTKGLKILSEAADVMKEFTLAVEDNKVTPEEVIAIKREVGELVVAIKSLSTKEPEPSPEPVPEDETNG